MRKFLKQNKRGGFTLVETLVALSIFSVSILGLMVVLSQGIADTTVAKKKNTASYLAQEGVEYIRNLRDTYVLYDSVSSSNGWTAFNNILLPTCSLPNGCYFDDKNVNYSNPTKPIKNLIFTSCSTACPQLLYTALSGKYDYALGGVNSGFIRTIKISSINVNEIKVYSNVSWTQGSGNYSITFSENLFNWVE